MLGPNTFTFWIHHLHLNHCLFFLFFFLLLSLLISHLQFLWTQHSDFYFILLLVTNWYICQQVNTHICFCIICSIHIAIPHITTFFSSHWALFNMYNFDQIYYTINHYFKTSLDEESTLWPVWVQYHIKHVTDHVLISLNQSKPLKNWINLVWTNLSEPNKLDFIPFQNYVLYVIRYKNFLDTYMHIS